LVVVDRPAASSEAVAVGLRDVAASTAVDRPTLAASKEVGHPILAVVVVAVDRSTAAVTGTVVLDQSPSMVERHRQILGAAGVEAAAMPAVADHLETAEPRPCTVAEDRHVRAVGVAGYSNRVLVAVGVATRSGSVVEMAC
jgi:hypothetical protein